MGKRTRVGALGTIGLVVVVYLAGGDVSQLLSSPDTESEQTSHANHQVHQAFAERKSDVIVRGSGRVKALIPDDTKGEVVKAFVTLQDNQLWDEESIAAFCREHLSVHKRPQQIELCADDLPRSFLGKVIRRKLREGD